MLSGEDEARLTFLAVRRWFGWSAGNLISLDIGGGSLELAAGGDEEPAVAVSLPLGAARLTREWFDDDPPGKAVGRRAARARRRRSWPSRRASCWTPARRTASSPPARPSARSPGWPARRRARRVRARRRLLTRTGLSRCTAFISRMPSADLAELDGVSVGRAHQTLAGAVVAAAAMDALGVEELELCPWAMREGVILRRLDWLTVADHRWQAQPRTNCRNTWRLPSD